MPTLLHIDSSPLESSISRELTREFVKTWKQKNPQGRVIHRDLTITPPKLIDQSWVTAIFTPAEALTAEQRETLAESEALIGELEQADEIVIGVAMHNFSIPAALKLWIDQIVRGGKTFVYTGSGVEGLLKGKKATVLTASGGVYELGTPQGTLNFIEPYLKAILGFVGISDVKFVTAGGASRVLRGAIDRETFLKPTLEQVRELTA